MRVHGQRGRVAREGAERVAQPRLLSVGTTQRLCAAFPGNPAEDGSTSATRLNRHGQSDALVERTDREGSLSVPRASRDAGRVRFENVAARLLEDVDDSAYTPGPGDQEP